MNTETTSIAGNETLNPTTETPTAAPAEPGGRARTGKIARLPYDIRKELNRRMRDGEPGDKLAAWLNSNLTVQAILATQFGGYSIKEQNLSQWRKGGHQDYLKQEEAREDLKAFLEEAKGLQEAAPEGVTDQVAFFLAAQIALELQQLRAAPDSPEKTKRWGELTETLLALRRGDLAMERIRVQRDRLGLKRKTEEEKRAEFWKWADENINRDEFCRRRCFTAEQRRAAINKILGITTIARPEVPSDPAAPEPVCSCGCCSPGSPPASAIKDQGVTESNPVKASQTQSDPITANQSQSKLINPDQTIMSTDMAGT